MFTNPTMASSRNVVSLPHVFCVNVVGGKGDARWQRIQDRWKIVQEDAMRSCSTILPDIIRWEATTPDTLPEPPRGPGKNLVFCRYLGAGQKACAWSHYRLWRYIVDYGIEHALVLEDDAVFRHGWLEELSRAPCMSEVDLLLLNASDEVLPMGKWTVSKDQCMTGAYIITLQGAHALIHHILVDTVWAADWSTQLLQRRGRSWTLFPWLVIQDGYDSFLQPSHGPDLAKVKRLLGQFVGESAFRELYMWEH
jgi:GR25 family glycosyltransferase involved in LPS biosynthesis